MTAEDISLPQNLKKGLNCPVCPAHDIPPEYLACENCGTDLSPIRRVLELGHLHYNRALQNLEAGDTTNAISELHGAIVTDPAMDSARLLLGKVLWKAGNVTGAVEQWRAVARNHPDDELVKSLLKAAKQKEPRRAPGQLRWSIVGLLATGLAFAAGWLSGGGGGIGQGSKISALPPVAVKTAVEPIQSKTEEAKEVTPAVAALPEPIRSQDTGFASTQPSRPVELDKLAEQLRGLEKLIVEVDDDILRVIPRDGLFPSGSEIPNGPSIALLKELQAAIDSVEIPLIIIITGFASSVPVKPGGKWRNNEELALFRSAQATFLLSTNSSRHRYLSSASDNDASILFKDAVGDRSRSRTVTLEIQAAPDLR